jgi:uncharacterized membrane protein
MRVAIASVRAGALGLAFLCAASGARAEIVFCNKFVHVVYAAIAYPQDDDSWISRGWVALDPGECSSFDTALHVKTFYYRGESEPFRDGGRRVKVNWGAGRKFAIWEKDNFNYWNAQNKVLNSSLADFTKGAEASADNVAATVTFEADGLHSSVTVK